MGEKLYVPIFSSTGGKSLFEDDSPSSKYSPPLVYELPVLDYPPTLISPVVESYPMF
jgi:hypothetical protein